MSAIDIADPSTLPAEATVQKKPTIALALGSGGAKGLAHIGAIEEIEAQGYEIVAIAGTSMGALIGGIYATGKLTVYRDWVCSLAKMDVLKLVDWTLSGGGLIKGERIIETMRGLIGDVAIEDLPLAYTAVATDLDREREVWLTRGPLFDAIRASIAIPTLFRPHMLSDRRLIDGGLLNPVPVTPLIRETADYLFAVSMDGPPDAGTPDVVPATPTANDDSYRSRITDFIGKLVPHGPDKPREPGMLEMLMQSMDLMQANLSRLRLAAYEPDLLIRMPRNVATVYEFYRATELIEMGRQQARQALANWQPNRGALFNNRP
ncbi:patatin-like phospholipase family protein [Dyella telluris]|uniref:Patatin-like phospholipase family protein n=1 Tax=Dyella telluris TaxID=2763498 RepID=A0A7G8Q9A8_9GAMM|nr:patatin-like phospholipase family protein [Dyella telluris]QNK03366.1 patatin-like phospholipase family protein [Dyella telluris]